MLLGMLLEAIETDLFFDPEDNKLKKYDDFWFDTLIIGMDSGFADKFGNSIVASNLRGDNQLYLELVYLVNSLLNELGLTIDTLPNSTEELQQLLNELLKIAAVEKRLLSQPEGRLKRGRRSANKMNKARLLFIVLLLLNTATLAGLIHNFAFQEYRLRKGENFKVWKQLEGQGTTPEIAPNVEENKDEKSPKL